MRNKTVDEVTARLLYGSNGALCNECGVPYECVLYSGTRYNRVCKTCENSIRSALQYALTARLTEFERAQLQMEYFGRIYEIDYGKLI